MDKRGEGERGNSENGVVGWVSEDSMNRGKANRRKRIYGKKIVCSFLYQKQMD